MSFSYDSVAFPDAKICVGVFAVIHFGGEQRKESGSCGAGSPLQFGLRFDKLGRFVVVIYIFTSEEQWQSLKANVTHDAVVRFVLSSNCCLSVLVGSNVVHTNQGRSKPTFPGAGA